MIGKKALMKKLIVVVIALILLGLFAPKLLYYGLRGTGHAASLSGKIILWATEKNKDKIIGTSNERDPLDEFLEKYDKNNETSKYVYMVQVIDYISKTNISEEQLGKIKDTFKDDKDFLGFINRTIKK